MVVASPCHVDRIAENKENIMSTLLSLPVRWCDPAKQYGAGCPAYGSHFERYGEMTYPARFSRFPEVP
jgi:hypothetical protein